jgi:hypothetical protein
MYRDSSYAPQAYRRWLGERMSGLLRKHGFGDRTTWTRPATLAPTLAPEALAALDPTPQPTLF